MLKVLLAVALFLGLSVGAYAQAAQADGSAAPAQAQPAAPAAAAPAQSGGGAPPVATPTAAPPQPIPFNHKLHVQTAKLGCNDCHEPNRGGATLAIPQPAKCMLCHAAIATDKPDVQRIAEAAKNDELISWVRVYRVPSFVTFSHKTHTSAGAKCEDCHGPVADRTAIAVEKDLHMGGCIACHQSHGAPASCDTCHAIMSKNGRSPFDADTTLLARLNLRPATTQAEVVPQAAAVSLWHGAAMRSSVADFLHAPSL